MPVLLNRDVWAQMEKTKSKPVLYQDYNQMDNAVIVVERTFEDIIEPYKKVTKIPDYLSLIDHSLAIESKKQYEKSLDTEQKRLNKLVRKLKDQQRYLIVVLQGRDGSGKSGATERIIEALDYDMKIFLCVPVGPPTTEEKNRPFLWRFTIGQRMPEYGQVRVFDRSWAERVLVERVMKFAKPLEIERSYGEIRAFEWLLANGGAILVKLWLDITKEEQLERFRKRAKEKPWKVDPADTTAREHWDDYTDAANEMFYRTGTDFGPWYLVSSEDKNYSRVAVLELINEALEQSL